MHNNIKLLTLSLLTLTSSNTIANETTYGLGAAINDGVKIYIPITTDNYLIEPSIFIISDKSQFGSPSFTSNDEVEILEVAVGLFRYRNIQTDTFLYYGARMGYRERTQKSATSITGNSSFNDSEKIINDSYIIAPTIGAEYKFTNNFSLGLDISLEYLSSTQKSTFNTDTFDTDRTSYKTKTEIIVRYRF